VEGEKKALDLAQLLTLDDTVYEDVDVPEWGGVVRLGSMTADMVLDWIEGNEGPQKKIAGLRILAGSLIGNDGQRMGVGPQEEALIQGLKKRNAEVVSRLTRRAMKLNGIGAEAEAERKNALSGVTTVASPID
jgi:hypothetical protein